MTIELKINDVDRTSDIVAGSLNKSDVINDEKDTLTFQIQKYGTVGFTPIIGQAVVLNIDGTTEFGGIILELKKTIKDGQLVLYDVVCVDYSFDIDRELVIERYDDKTVNFVIDAIVTKYASDYTVTNVNCTTVIATMVFNRISITECLDKLAKEVGYSWYIDSNKDIHFFVKTENPAPFEITDTNGMYVQNSLIVKDDLSQIRNKVTIRGAEERASERTESYLADGDQITFPLTNKFAELPVVYVQNQIATTTVGIDYLSKEEDYDCFWNFGQKYIRFKEATKPDITEKVDITGIPLFPVLVRISEPVSIAEYGLYEFFKEDKNIQSRDEALTYALAQLEAYKEGIAEGNFETNTSGLRSGQIITIDSDLLGIDETFLIQSVRFRLLAKDKGEWSVKLATLRTISIIQVLQDLISTREVREFDPDNLLSLLQFDNPCVIIDSVDATATTTEDYTWDDGVQPNPIIWNLFTWKL